MSCCRWEKAKSDDFRAWLMGAKDVDGLRPIDVAILSRNVVAARVLVEAGSLPPGAVQPHSHLQLKERYGDRSGSRSDFSGADLKRSALTHPLPVRDRNGAVPQAHVLDARAKRASRVGHPGAALPQSWKEFTHCTFVRRGRALYASVPTSALAHSLTFS